MFEQEREHTATLETLTEIAREVGAILDLDELLHRIGDSGQARHRLSDVRDPAVQRSHAAAGTESGAATRRKDQHAQHQDWRGLVGHSMLHKVPMLVNDVSKDLRYIPVVKDVRSELVIPLMVKDRCLACLTSRALS